MNVKKKRELIRRKKDQFPLLDLGVRNLYRGDFYIGTDELLLPYSYEWDYYSSQYEARVSVYYSDSFIDPDLDCIVDSGARVNEPKDRILDHDFLKADYGEKLDDVLLETPNTLWLEVVCPYRENAHEQRYEFARDAGYTWLDKRYPYKCALDNMLSTDPSIKIRYDPSFRANQNRPYGLQSI